MDFNAVLKQMLQKNKHYIIKTFPERNLGITYRDLDYYSKHYMAFLQQHGIKNGQVIALWMGNTPEFLFITEACLRMGVAIFPLNVFTKAEQLNELIQTYQYAWLFFDSNHIKIKESLSQESMNEILSKNTTDVSSFSLQKGIHVPEISEEINWDTWTCKFSDEAPIAYLETSGSTGKRRVYAITVNGMFGKNFANGTGKLVTFIHRIKKIRLANLTPWYHHTGLNTLLIPLVGGAYEEIVWERFQLERISKDLITCKPLVCIGTPTMFYRLCKKHSDYSGIMGAICTGELLNPYVMEAIDTSLKANLIMSGYGTTEAGSIAQLIYQRSHCPLWLKIILLIVKKKWNITTITQSDLNTKNEICLGTLISEERLYLHQPTYNNLYHTSVGEICYESPKKYLALTPDQRNELGITIDGKNYIRTGDLGYIKSGKLFLAGRIKNMIIRSGEKILPAPIENLLMQQPEIENVIVCGVPDKDYGEEICACIILKECCSINSEWKALISNNISPLHIPRYFLPLKQFPTNASGKSDRRMLAEYAKEYLSLK